MATFKKSVCVQIDTGVVWHRMWIPAGRYDRATLKAIRRHLVAVHRRYFGGDGNGLGLLLALNGKQLHSVPGRWARYA